jgi:hypothetical protein
MPDYTFSEITDPVGGVGAKSEFTTNILAIPLGKAIVIGGSTISNTASRANQVGRAQEPKRKYSCRTLADGRIQVTRTL